MKIKTEHAELMLSVCVDKFTEMLIARNNCPSDRYFQCYESLVNKLRDYVAGDVDFIDLSIGEMISLCLTCGSFSHEVSTPGERQILTDLFYYLRGVIYFD